MTQKGVSATLIILILASLAALAILYFINWNKYNNLSAEEKMAAYNKKTHHLVSPGVYSWPKIGLTIKVPDNFTAANEILVGGPIGDPELPTGIEITRHSGEAGAASESATYSDFVHIAVYKFSGNVNNFYQGNAYRKRGYNFNLIETTRVGGTEAKWYLITAIRPFDTGRYNEIYFVNGKYGFILEARASWDKKEIIQILDGISFVTE